MLNYQSSSGAVFVWRQSTFEVPAAGTLGRRNSFRLVTSSGCAQVFTRAQYKTGGSSVSLVIADATHSHAADAPGLTLDSHLTIADASHAHAADNLTLSTESQAALVIADAGHAHTADNLGLTTQWLLTVADSLHGHSADAPTLTTELLLAISDAAHAHSADGLTLDASNAINLLIADALHAHAADGVTLTTASTLQIADALHVHLADVVVLSLPSGLTLTQADIDAIVAAIMAHMLGARSFGAHIQAIAAPVVGNQAGAGTTHVTYTDGSVTVEADVPLPNQIGNRTNVQITGV